MILGQSGARAEVAEGAAAETAGRLRALAEIGTF